MKTSTYVVTPAAKAAALVWATADGWLHGTHR
jgi:hypothetical protein